MKIHTILAIVALGIALAGCCSLHSQRSAYEHGQEFRKQIEASIPVQQWGYTIKDMRFSDDRKKVLVIFDTPADNRQEVIFKEDDFHRYRGKVWDFDKRDKKTGGLPMDAYQFVTVIF